MSEEQENAESISELEPRTSGRHRTLSVKALGHAIRSKQREFYSLNSELNHVMQSADSTATDKVHVLSKLNVLVKSLSTVKDDLNDLFQQDKCGEYKDDIESMGDQVESLSRARLLIDSLSNLSNANSDKLSESVSQVSSKSRRSKKTTASSASSSTVRLRALAEAAAAKEKAEFERFRAERENEERQREADEAKRKAEYAKDMTILNADMEVAVANAKLKAIEEALSEADEVDAPEKAEAIGHFPPEPAEVRTRNWIHESSDASTHGLISEQEFPKTTVPVPPAERFRDSPSSHTEQPPFDSSVPGDANSRLVESQISTNEKIIASLARQNLPKCQPDVFNGDVTIFYPWKRAFKAMIKDAYLSPEQEINYLRMFTSGEVQKVVDNFRKRQHDPSTVLEKLWRELERRFGSSAVISNTFISRLQETAEFDERNLSKLQTFSDLCADVESQIDQLPNLACLNYPNTLRPIVNKLPTSIREKWEKEVANFAEKNNDRYPSFSSFAQLIEKHSRIKNHPNILAMNQPPKQNSPKPKTVLTTTISSGQKEVKNCPFHERKGHTLTECKVFSGKPLQERTNWLKSTGLCFRCLSPTHRARECKANISCGKCGDRRHADFLHEDNRKPEASYETPTETVDTKCTEICNRHDGGLSCSKIALVDVFLEEKPEDAHRVYAIIDDQSNASMISPELTDALGISSTMERYFLSTCNSSKETKFGRRVPNLVVQSLAGKTYKLPTLIECDNIPRDKKEIPTPDLAQQFGHLAEIASEIPPVDHHAEIHLLFGRDASELLKVRAFKNGPKGAPWAQKLFLGWTISGKMCLDTPNMGPVHVQAKRTTLTQEDIKTSKLVARRNHIKGDTLPSKEAKEFQPHEENEFIPCPNYFKVNEYHNACNQRKVEENVFYTSPDDNDVSLSCDDRKFLEIMDREIHKNETGNWELPLPFKDQNVKMPNNRSQAEQRLQGLLRTLKRKPQMQTDYVEFMGKMLDRGHAAPVSPKAEEEQGKVWYLPHFGVYHPKKPGQIRVVFDSSAEFHGTSLNKELLAGPDLMNSLLGVLLRFRSDDVAVMCDVEQMFHSFHVDPRHRNFLRFLWFEDNDPSKKIIEYQMSVHLFGNGSSPAVATYALRRTGLDGEERFGPDIKEFIHRNFYVDDGLASRPTAKEAIQLLKNTQTLLATANLRLHKMVSNSVEVMEALPADDRGKDLRNLDLHKDSLPAQRSLGVFWNLENDAFTFRVTLPEKPFTRRGVLSVVNSIYDPLGIAIPVVLEGRLLLQQLVLMGKKTRDRTPLGWDDPLPEILLQRWKTWKDSLIHLEKLQVPRCYHPRDFGRIVRSEIHAFSDASKDAIGTAIYLRLLNQSNDVHVSFLYAQARVAPAQATSIPRLELCGAVLSAQAVNKITKEIDMNIDAVKFYTDSKVVLGYIQNESRRFHVYVANRVQLIRRVSQPDQWQYIDTSVNPADMATRKLTTTGLMESNWLTGPAFLWKPTSPTRAVNEIQLNEDDPEVRKEVVTCKVSKSTPSLGSSRFSRFSTLSSLQRAIATLIARIKAFKRSRSLRSQTDAGKSPDRSRCLTTPTIQDMQQALTTIIKACQEDAFSEEIKILSKNQDKPRDNPQLQSLDPFLDEEGVLRVGGRLRYTSLEYRHKHPVIVPKGHHLSRLIISHHHTQVHHQGRQITHGAIRQAGYWLIGGHRAVAKELHQCVTCRRLRGPFLEQCMANLPEDRGSTEPPFTYVGLDVFGPWTIQTRRMRGGAMNSKRWPLLFTCLNSRAIHIEVLESMDTDSFICALRRFFAIRGPVKRLRSDCGTNFKGGKSELDEALQEMDKAAIGRYVLEQGCEWVFNPPHASHFGGVWERQISTIRRILNAMLLELKGATLTHELFCTLLAEVTAIVNARPLTSIPSDIDEPQPLSPGMILTMKSRPLAPPPGNFLPSDLYSRHRWRRVQALATQFWKRWRQEYLQTLQLRNKWKHPKRNLAEGDIVLLKEESDRNHWPLAVVTKAFKSKDGMVRKVEVRITREGTKKIFNRPIKELVLLITASEKKI